jgi:hypothetical protein
MTGAGLALVVYALITPISEKVFRERTEKLESLLRLFEKEKTKLAIDAVDKDFNRLKQPRKEIASIEDFPRYLGIGILATFGFFVVSLVSDAFDLFIPPSSLTIL